MLNSVKHGKPADCMPYMYKHRVMQKSIITSMKVALRNAY